MLQSACCEQAARAASCSSPQTPPKSPNIFTTLYSRFCDWVASARKDSLLARKLSGRRASGSRSRSGSCNSARTADWDVSGYPPGYPVSPEDFHRCCHASVSSEDSEFGSFYLASYSSTCSNLTLTSTSTTASEYHRPPVDSWGLSPGSEAPYRLLSADLDASGSPLLCEHYPAYPVSPDSPQQRQQPDLGLLDQCPGLPPYPRTRASLQSVVQRPGCRPNKPKYSSVCVWSESKTEVPDRALCDTWPPCNSRLADIGTTWSSTSLLLNLLEVSSTLNRELKFWKHPSLRQIELLTSNQLQTLEL